LDKLFYTLVVLASFSFENWPQLYPDAPFELSDCAADDLKAYSEVEHRSWLQCDVIAEAKSQKAFLYQGEVIVIASPFEPWLPDVVIFSNQKYTIG
jgi:hypothetical protein